jgi:hypothetical protein
MDNNNSRKKTYLLAVGLGALGGGLITMIVTKAIPKMMSQVMSGMMQSMMAQMGEIGYEPAEI